MNAQRPLFWAAKATRLGDRPSNQDRSLFLATGETILLGLADGLGGHPRGEIAAQMLMDVCESLFRQAEKPLPDPEYFMLQCIGKAHSSIIRFGRRQRPPIAPRTTAVLAVIQRGMAYWVHVGDSRLYLLRDGEVHAQTRDHSQVHYVRESANEASRPRASLTRCLGGLTQPPTTTCGPPTPLERGDVLLLCSDGLWSQVPRQALTDSLCNREESIVSCLDGLLDQAVAKQPSDNVTAIVLNWAADGDASGSRAALQDAPLDPRLERAIAHLHDVLKKTHDT